MDSIEKRISNGKNDLYLDVEKLSKTKNSICNTLCRYLMIYRNIII